MVLLTNLKIESPILLGKVARSTLFIRNNANPRAEIYSSISWCSQNILSKCKLKTTYIKHIKLFLDQHHNSVEFIKSRESSCYDTLHTFSDLEKFLKWCF